jgi:hypothetical protein
MLEIEYEFGDRDLVHYNELQIDQSEDLQKKLKRNRLIFPGILALFGLFLWNYYDDYRTAIYIVFSAKALGSILKVYLPNIAAFSSSL